eukprot:TRINITY_DN961_c6_g1_i1.p1 TRINITY_DN961_c6_g1~~TRINITY_DN961_c6_g1_i1.p1  ORF type:complete len:233 (+),score=56.98 TRINITY_DN961_c6_g1_i1:48-701(+)
MAVKRAQDTSNWPEIRMYPPCGHKQWVRVSRMEGTVVFLQCKRCWGPWRTDLNWHDKCPGHFSGGCIDENCKHVHIFRARPKRRRNHNRKFSEASGSSAEGATTGGNSPVTCDLRGVVGQDLENECDGPPQLCEEDSDDEPSVVQHALLPAIPHSPVLLMAQQQQQQQQRVLNPSQYIGNMNFVQPVPPFVTAPLPITHPQGSQQPVQYVRILPMTR